MTTLNTIIEEEKKEATKQLWMAGDLEPDEPIYRKETVENALTTAMQRAYEAGRQSVLDEWKEEQKKFTEGFAYRKPQGDTN